MNKCVYLHRDNNGNVFYVGQGSKTRPYATKSRSKDWHLIADKGFTVEIISENLTSKQVIDLEDSLISKYTGLVNKISTKVKTLDFDYLSEWFCVSEESPTGLVWKKSNNANSPMNIKNEGDVAGIILKRPCGKTSGWVLSLYKTKFQVHRIVWLLSGNKLDDNLVIDHKDGNPLNNRIENLRQVSHTINSRNQAIRDDNLTGITGVQRDFMGNTYYYVATWYENGKQKRKAFSLKKYGESALDLAVNFRLDKLNQLNALGLDYSERHGK